MVIDGLSSNELRIKTVKAQNVSKAIEIGTFNATGEATYKVFDTAFAVAPRVFLQPLGSSAIPGGYTGTIAAGSFQHVCDPSGTAFSYVAIGSGVI